MDFKRIRVGGVVYRKAQRGVEPIIKMLETRNRVLTKDPDADVRELDETIDNHLKLLSSKEKQQIEPVLRRYGYGSSVNK